MCIYCGNVLMAQETNGQIRQLSSGSLRLLLPGLIAFPWRAGCCRGGEAWRIDIWVVEPFSNYTPHNITLHVIYVLSDDLFLHFHQSKVHSVA